MPEVQLCVHCKEAISKAEEYVVVRKEHQGAPEIVAHVKCRQKELQGRGTEVIRG